MVTPVSNKPMSSEELVISSPLQDYPTRNVDFQKYDDVVEPGPVYGTYSKANGTDLWKYWQNTNLVDKSAKKDD